MNRILHLKEETQERCNLYLPCDRESRCPSENQEEGLHKMKGPGLSASRTVRNRFLLFEPHSLRCFAIAVWTKISTYSHCCGHSVKTV